MAIPSSTFVMGFLTAGLFGLAIMDTATGTAKATEDRAATEAQRDEDAAQESIDRARREYEELEAKHATELAAVLQKLVGLQAVQPRAPHYVIGEKPPQDNDEAVLELQRVARAEVQPSLNDDGTLKSVKFTFPQYDEKENVCLLLSQRLEESWGSSERTYDDEAMRKHWVSFATKQRATFTDPAHGRCSLEIERYIPAEEIVTSVPLAAIGKPAAKLRETLGDAAYADDTQIRWTKPGVGIGYGEIELYARIVKGKVVTITAKFQMLGNAPRTVAEHLPRDPAPKVDVQTINEDAGMYLLVAGEPLPVEE